MKTFYNYTFFYFIIFFQVEGKGLGNLQLKI